MGLHAWSHLSLTVSDLERSTAWYQAVLDWRQQGTSRSDTTTFAFGQLSDGFSIVLRQHDQPVDGPFDERRPGLDHICLAADSLADLETLAEKLAAIGSVFDPPRELPYGWLLTFRDPDNIAHEALFPTA